MGAIAIGRHGHQWLQLHAQIEAPEGQPGTVGQAAAAMTRQQFLDVSLALVNTIDAPLERPVISEQIGRFAEVALVRVIPEGAAQPLDSRDGFDVGRLLRNRLDAGFQCGEPRRVIFRQRGRAQRETQKQAQRQGCCFGSKGHRQP